MTPEILDAMLASGCTAEQIVAAVKASMSADESRRSQKREKDAERQRRHRASRNVTRDNRDTPHPPSLDKEIPPTPPKEIKPSPLTPQTTQLGAGAEDDFGRLSERLVDAADGKMQPHTAIVVGPILELIAQGVDLETDILPAIRAKAAALSEVVSLKYFLGPIRDAYSRRIEAGQGLSKPKVSTIKADAEMTPEELRAAWIKRLNFGRMQRQWFPFWGPMPGQAGCTCPADLLEPKDGQHPDGSPWDLRRIEAA